MCAYIPDSRSVNFFPELLARNPAQIDNMELAILSVVRQTGLRESSAPLTL